MKQKRFSMMGRPRRLGEAEIARILAWHRNRTTLQALARELNVCASTVRKVIRSEGRDYKQPPPEQRAEVLQALRRQREERAMEGRAWRPAGSAAKSS